METTTQKILFLLPPFTQPNTPYPSTAFLKGFLKTKNIPSRQADLGLEVLLHLFSSEGLTAMFSEIDLKNPGLTGNFSRILSLRQDYVLKIDPVIAFLQGKNPELSHLICSRNWLPEASRFNTATDLKKAFGFMGIQDLARHLASLFLEDITDLIHLTIDPRFGFSRYAERMGSSPATFDELNAALDQKENFIDGILFRVLEEKLKQFPSTLVALSLPFPGNLYSAFRCGQWIKRNFPAIKVVAGGGYVNTELRTVSDPRVFNYVDFIILDDGEIPLLHLLAYLDGKRKLGQLKRTFIRENNKLVFYNGSDEPDCRQDDTGTPDYSDLPLDRYLAVLEMVNPMHRLWSDGRWNRLLLAHGCYWAKCTFCDVNLDYIKRYDSNTASRICDRMEELIAQNGQTGFHFVDEAAPPVLLRELAREILRRKLTVSWWTNIRFEKNFTRDLCRLLSASGCIAVSGGLEVASDRVLKLVNKGVNVLQAVRVAGNFSRAGIMVHAYLMYGFPTQTVQETIDALEVVRQMFKNGILQSGFWHLFTMTAHSPVGMDPAKFEVIRESYQMGTFANNDLTHIDPKGCEHENFGDGLRKALYNYMHGMCFDDTLQDWFDFPIPVTTVAPRFIQYVLENEEAGIINPGTMILWIGGPCSIVSYNRKKKGKIIPSATLTIHNLKKEFTIQLSENQGKWLYKHWSLLSVPNHGQPTFEQLEQDFTRELQGDFRQFLDSVPVRTLREAGLILL